MLPSVTELTYFHEVANASSFSRAALKLNISQPSLSMAVKKLEDSLGESLFIRHKHGVTLTPAGEVLFNEVTELINKWTSIQTALQAAHHEIGGKVNLGCHSTLSPFIGGLLTELMTKHPKLEIHLEHASTPNILDEIVLGNIDIGVVLNPVTQPDIVLSKIKEVEFTFWTALNLANQIDFANQDITIYCDLELPQTQYLLKKLRVLYNKNFRLSTSNQLETIAIMAANGGGVGIIASCFAEAIYPDKLKPVPNAPAYVNTMYFARHYKQKSVTSIDLVWHALKEFAAASEKARQK